MTVAIAISALSCLAFASLAVVGERLRRQPKPIPVRVRARR